MEEDKKIYLVRGNDTPMSVLLRKKEGDDTYVDYDLTGAERLRLALVGHGMHVFARDVEADGNLVSGVISGRSLLKGAYDLEVTFRLDGKDKRFPIEGIIEVVDYIEQDVDDTAEGEGGGIAITLTIQPEEISIAGPKGDPGGLLYPTFSVDDDMHLIMDTHGDLEKYKFLLDDNGHLVLEY